MPSVLSLLLPYHVTDLLDSLSRLLGVVVRHVGEKVVRDVRVGDVVEDAVQEAVGAVRER